MQGKLVFGGISECYAATDSKHSGEKDWNCCINAVLE